MALLQRGAQGLGISVISLEFEQIVVNMSTEGGRVACQQKGGAVEKVGEPLV